MTIQVCRMKYSDEQVIADIGEVYANDEAKENGERPISMSFKNPYSLHIVNESEQGYNITFKKWNPYSDDGTYHVGFDLIGLISNGKPAVVEAYEQKVTVDTTPVENTNEETTTTE